MDYERLLNGLDKITHGNEILWHLVQGPLDLVDDARVLKIIERRSDGFALIYPKEGEDYIPLEALEYLKEKGIVSEMEPVMYCMDKSISFVLKDEYKSKIKEILNK